MPSTIADRREARALTVRGPAPLTVAVLLYAATALLLPTGLSAVWAYAFELFPLPLAIIPVAIAVTRYRFRTGASYRTAWRAVVTGPRLLRLIGTLVLAQLFFAAFMAWKAALPTLVPFWADPALADLDRWLHGGTHPWVWLAIHDPLALRILETAYYLYFPIMGAGVLWYAWATGPHRDRVGRAFVLTWIVLGTVMAYALSSAGPIFYDRLALGTDPYALLRTHLASVPGLRNAWIAGALWGAYADGALTSIAAMPSLHVAMPTLYVCATRGRLRWLAALYLATILTGSVALGWHYAVDGYASILGVLLLWRMARSGQRHGEVTRRELRPLARRDGL